LKNSLIAVCTIVLLFCSSFTAANATQIFSEIIDPNYDHAKDFTYIEKVTQSSLHDTVSISDSAIVLKNGVLINNQQNNEELNKPVHGDRLSFSDSVTLIKKVVVPHQTSHKVAITERIFERTPLQIH